MKNRHERRKARKGDVITVDIGRLQQRDPNYGLPVSCYVCGAAHTASGLARIQDKRSTKNVALCDACLADGTVDHLVVRKFLGASGMTFSEGGKVTTEQIIALADKQDTTEH